MSLREEGNLLSLCCDLVWLTFFFSFSYDLRKYKILLKSEFSCIESGNKWKEKTKSLVQDTIHNNLPVFFEFEGGD